MRPSRALGPLLLLLSLGAAGCSDPQAPAGPGDSPADLAVMAGPADLAAYDRRPDMARGIKAVIVHGGDERGAAALRGRLAALGGFSQLLLFNAGTATPDALLLVSYDAVLVYSVGPFSDPDLLGDRLVDFVGGGGGVVAAMLTTTARDDPTYPNLFLGGRFRSGGYYALAPDSGYRGREGAPVGLGQIHDPNDPLVTGLRSFSGGINSFRPRDNRVSAGAARVADWADGSPLVVQKMVGGRLRVDLGFFPAPDYDGSGQNWISGGDILVRNALSRVARR